MHTPDALETLDPDDFEAAYARTRPQAEALDTTDLEVLNVEIEHATGVVLSNIGRLLSLRPRMALLPEFDIACLDELETRAMALAYSHACYVAESAPVDLRDARAEGIALRRMLKSNAAGLLPRGLLPSQLLDNLSNGKADRKIAGDLLALAMAFLDELDGKLVGKTPVTRDELRRASEVARDLMIGSAQNDRSISPLTQKLALARQRVFTLFVRDYAEVRDAVAFLRRRDNDADDFAPSLHAAHAKRLSRKAPKPAAP